MGLNSHKDDEPAHASDQVITLCHGVGATFVLEDNSHHEVAREWLEGGDFDVFRDQKSFYHGVDSVELAGAGQWAFTFRVLKPPSKPVRSVPASKPLVSDSVVGWLAFYGTRSRMDILRQTRNKIKQTVKGNARKIELKKF